MKKTAFLFLVIFLIATGVFIQFSCKKKSDTEVHPVYLKVDLPRHELKHKLYYNIHLSERSIELSFSEALDASTVDGNIIFRDHEGDLSTYTDTEHSVNQVLIMFKPDFELKHGWKYEISILPGLRSESGLSMPPETSIECRTGIGHGMLYSSIQNGNSGKRNSIAIISDIHMGDQRAYDNNYCWFGKNQVALEAFLDYVRTDSSGIKQLVILGDLFDEWLVPYTISPFDSSISINSTRDFFNAVAGAHVNETIFDKFKEIVNHDSVELIYVPGNHDMLGTQDILNEIIPGASWEGGPAGLGKYMPFPEMIFEHGHRYDFFNCPQPLVNPDHKLPPGYFVSRLYAKGMMDATADKSIGQASGSFEFKAAWDIAFLYTIAHFRMDLPDVFAKNILMGGIDGYFEPMSFHGTKEMYAASIEGYWAATQAQNEVPVPIACCFHAIWNGHSDLFTAAETQYMKQPPAPKAYKIIAFGHTHEAMLEVYPKKDKYTSIYANSGTWIDAEEASPHPVRTYLLITPKTWTGSEIDVVGLYQFNKGTDNKYKPKKLKEESIK